MDNEKKAFWFLWILSQTSPEGVVPALLEERVEPQVAPVRNDVVLLDVHLPRERPRADRVRRPKKGRARPTRVVGLRRRNVELKVLRGLGQDGELLAVVVVLLEEVSHLGEEPGLEAEGHGAAADEHDVGREVLSRVDRRGEEAVQDLRG